MIQEFKQHIETHFSFLKNSKNLLAISGGIDSVVLAHLIHKIGFDFSLCHCNFQLRGKESDKDEAFVKSLGKEFKVSVFTTRFDTEEFAQENKLSIQVAARELRYGWFYKLIANHEYDYVVTAHNANDNLETFLINLTRGTGLEGLTGIPPINKKSIRPLLKFSRDDIMKYAIKNDIVWREDKSNASTKYTRNKIRHKVLPILNEINPNLLESFQKTLDHLNESQAIIDDKVQEVSDTILSIENDLIKIDIQKLSEMKNKKTYLYQILSPYGFTEWNNVVDLISAQSGKELFSETHRLLKDRTSLILTKINTYQRTKESFLIEEGEKKIENPIQLTIEKTDQKKTDNQNIIVVDKNLLNFPLHIRKWKNGDSIYPVGMKGRKKLSQLFKDKKMSLLDKEKVWLLTDIEDNIIWVIGIRQDRRFSTNTSNINRLKISHIL